MPRLALAIAAVSASAAIAGCGGSSHHPRGATNPTAPAAASSAGAAVRTIATPSSVGCAAGARACITQSPQATVLGSTNLNLNLTALIAHDQHTLRRPHLTCRSSQSYPIHCAFAAFDTTRHTTVVGTAKILGVYTLTHTYVYQLNYGAPTANPGGARTAPPARPRSGSTGI